MSCTANQTLGGCFEANGKCVTSCRNVIDPGCLQAGMYGAVKDCPYPVITAANPFEGWSNPSRCTIYRWLAIVAVIIFIILAALLIFKKR